MIQEVITYGIIAAAIAGAILRLKKRFAGIKKEKECSEPATLNSSGCDGCGADCPVRQAPFATKK